MLVENCLAPCWNVKRYQHRAVGDWWDVLMVQTELHFRVRLWCLYALFPFKIKHWVITLAPRPHENRCPGCPVYPHMLYIFTIWFWVPPNSRNINCDGVRVSPVSCSSISMVYIKIHTNWKPFNITGITFTAHHHLSLLNLIHNGAWAPRDLSGKRVHVYINFTFIERMVLDSYITKCIYLFIIFYLKLTYITACLLKQKESEQKESVDETIQTYFFA